MDTNLGDRTVHFLSISSTCTASESTISTPYLEQTIVELGNLEREEGEEREWPFKIELELAKRVDGERKVVWGTVDGGAMLCVIDSTVWAQVEHWFGRLRDSHIICRMANGSCVPSLGTGAGVIGYQGHVWPIRFEVIDSRGAFELLLGKDWLCKAGAMQVFRTDSLALPLQTGTIVVENKNPRKPRPEQKPAGPRSMSTSREDAEKSIEPTAEQASASSASGEPEPAAGSQGHVVEPGEPVPRRSARLRKMVESGGEANPMWVEPEALEAVEGLLLDGGDESNMPGPPDGLWQKAGVESEEETMRGVLLIEPVSQAATHGLTEVLRRADRNRAREDGPVDLAKISIESRPKPIPNKPPVPESPRMNDPFGEKRVAEILQRVQIGEDLTDEQRANVQGLLREYADVFALNLSEVLPVDFTEMKLDIPTDTTFPRRTGQRKLSEPQRQALYTMLDELEDAHVIEKVTQDQVAAVSPINMVPKHGGADRTSLDTLRRMANSECRKYGLPVKYLEAGFYKSTEAKPEGAPAKWRLVQNFAAVNKVTQIRPFPMGDLAAKQRAVTGHQFVSVMDLQAGFHAIPIAPESVPYTGFYVEGQGHYVYRQMLFGLTGAPTTFCEMVAHAFHELLGKILEVWMDDMATAADDFDTGMTNL
ncbi:Retrovirus-related Pol polyprotein from transposon opus [Ceratobasidium sp. AG-Ba]|nr:Retrovirus-related Pol polyprotein from transposon opus [Ceratobasidium sp. AG-Ba]